MASVRTRLRPAANARQALGVQLAAAVLGLGVLRLVAAPAGQLRVQAGALGGARAPQEGSGPLLKALGGGHPAKHGISPWGDPTP